MTKPQLFCKWTILVWLNAAFSFFMALGNSARTESAIAGMICGVFTFVVLYYLLDLRLLQQGKDTLRKWLLIGVIIKALTQFLPAIEIAAGMAAVGLVEIGVEFAQQFGYFLSSTGLDSFIKIYLITVIDGVLLSLAVGIFVLLIKLFCNKVLPLFKKPKEAVTSRLA
ncbi:hypothetical protein [Leucothrix arctica]|uniref:Uncharacterized protein n=1 Tax=Leucothrix arctica TaxID=1481894 RepID=A0A317CD04_9GAMM|nr:hypothetical protein [Leucothrix arctica]PWQ95233.1 hypothetical protein DKT75_12880 [Leucothrix arctica]